MENTNQKLHIKFDGINLASGTIDAYDLATTVMASADTLRNIANNIPSVKNSELKVDVNALREGSFEVSFSVSLKDALDYGVAITPLLNSATINSAKEVVKTLKSVIETIKFLKGEKPSKVEINQNGNNPTAVVYNFTGDNTTIHMNTYNSMQDKQVTEKLKKVFKPISKENSEVDFIEISIAEDSKSDDSKITVNKEEVIYFEKTEELQIIPSYKIRGIVTAMDRKTNNGKLTTGDEKRCNFEIDIEDISLLEKVSNGVIDSMKTKVPILVMGEAVLDLEMNLKKIKIKNIEEDSKLF